MNGGLWHTAQEGPSNTFPVFTRKQKLKRGRLVRRVGFGYVQKVIPMSRHPKRPDEHTTDFREQFRRVGERRGWP
jgi:hypothetical protein